MQRSECSSCKKCCATKRYAANLRIKAPMTRKGGKRLLSLPFYRSSRKQQATFKKLKPVLVQLELILIYLLFFNINLFLNHPYSTLNHLIYRAKKTTWNDQVIERKEGWIKNLHSSLLKRVQTSSLPTSLGRKHIFSVLHSLILRNYHNSTTFMHSSLSGNLFNGLTPTCRASQVVIG